MFRKRILLTSLLASATLFASRKIQLRGDRIRNDHNQPILDHIAEKTAQGRAPRFVTTDSRILDIAKNFPKMPINHANNPDPHPKPISILPLSQAPKEVQECFANETGKFVGCGGPSARIEIFQKAIEGKPAVLIQNGQIYRYPADHFQPDAVNETPAFTGGKTVTWFLKHQLKELFFPSRFDRDVIKPGYTVFSLDVFEWVRHPEHWRSGFQVAWGNHQLSRKYAQQMKAGFEPSVWNHTRYRMNASRQYIEALSQYWPGILRPASGAITLAATEKATAANKADVSLYEKEGLTYTQVIPDQVKNLMDFLPSGANSFWWNAHDRIVCDDFHVSIYKGIEAHGGQVIMGEITGVFDDTSNQQGGVVVYTDQQTGEERYQKYSKLTLALGNTSYTGPNRRHMIGVEGFSSDLIVIPRDPSKTRSDPLQEIPLTIDGPNHLVPMGSEYVPVAHPITGEKRNQWVTHYRYTTGGFVRPLSASDGSFNAKHSVHAISRLLETLPENRFEVQTVEARGCVRILDEQGQQNEVNALLEVDGKVVQSNNITLVRAAGGGGYTAMGAMQGPHQVEILKAKGKLTGNSSALYGKWRSSSVPGVAKASGDLRRIMR